jgi:hypothetical protein
MVFFLALMEASILFVVALFFFVIGIVVTKRYCEQQEEDVLKCKIVPLLKKIESETSSAKIETFVTFVRITIVFVKQAQK